MVRTRPGALRHPVEVAALPSPARPAQPRRDGAPAAELPPPPRYTHLTQRVLDVLLSLAGLALFAPVLPLLAAAIKLDSPGPVFFAQERVGLERRRRRRAPGIERRRAVAPGRPFRVWKLRTMVTDAERDGPQWAARNDARVTRLGRVLRKSRLDEVPQFWNVLRGEMSVVGPRPERLCFVNQFEQSVPRYRDRLLVRPGITGLAQIENGYDTDLASVRRKVALDRRYVREIGLTTDLAILMRTVKVVMKGSGAH